MREILIALILFPLLVSAEPTVEDAKEFIVKNATYSNSWDSGEKSYNREIHFNDCIVIYKTYNVSKRNKRQTIYNCYIAHIPMNKDARVTLDEEDSEVRFYHSDEIQGQVSKVFDCNNYFHSTHRNEEIEFVSTGDAERAFKSFRIVLNHCQAQDMFK